MLPPTVIFVANRPLRFVLLLVACVLLVVGLRLAFRKPSASAGPAKNDSFEGPAGELDFGRIVRTPTGRDAAAADPSLAAALRRRFQPRDARPNEGVLAFRDLEAYRRFLARAQEAGLRVLDKNDALLSVRVGFDSLGGLQRDLVENASDYSDLGSNRLVHVPGQPPPTEERAAHPQVPVGAHLLNLLGLSGLETSRWGLGTTVAILDSGVARDGTFDGGRIRYLDIGLGINPGRGTDDGHGTAVAALAAGASPDARGISPAANILSIRVTDDTSQSDIFTLSRAIVAAVDYGARVVNVSLGAYGTSLVLDRAIDYAVQRGAVIVAAAGNDQAAQLAWPAADPRVISVGAVDGAEQQVMFSNSGPQLKLSAPGYAVQTAWLDNQRVNMSGTSASAPIVSGAIAAVMSQSPGLSANQAWQVLQQYSTDAGPLGHDPDYGSGILNLGWAIGRNDSTRIDTAVSGQYFNPTTSTMEFVVQNRSTRGIASLNLAVAANGVSTSYPIHWLNAGASTVVKFPLSAQHLSATGQVEFRAYLANPSGLTDSVPANNSKAATIGVSHR